MSVLSTVCRLIRQECSGVPQGGAAKLQFFAFYCRKSSVLFFIFMEITQSWSSVSIVFVDGAPSRNLRRGESHAEGSYSWAPYAHRNTRCLVDCPAAVQAMGNSSPADWLLGLACRWSPPAGWCQGSRFIVMLELSGTRILYPGRYENRSFEVKSHGDIRFPDKELRCWD
jgi:hypothetical protein